MSQMNDSEALLYTIGKALVNVVEQNVALRAEVCSLYAEIDRSRKRAEEMHAVAAKGHHDSVMAFLGGISDGSITFKQK